MTLVLNGTTGVSSVDGSASTPAIQGADTNTGVFFPAADTVAVATGGSERMRVDSAGAMLVGTSTTPSSNNVRLAIAGRSGSASNAGFEFITDGGGGGALFSNNGAGIQFLTFTGAAGSESYTERARIDSSGNLLVGKTSSSPTVQGGVMYSDGRVFSTISNSQSDSFTLYNVSASAYRFYVTSAGQIYATSTSIAGISDQSLKENIRDLDTGLPEVMALKPRRFDWKNGDAQNVAGFIAQEVEQVLPELVADYVYNKDEEGNDIIKKSLKMGDILPTLVKAMQEQQALIQELKAELDALKAQVAGAQA